MSRRRQLGCAAASRVYTRCISTWGSQAKQATMMKDEFVDPVCGMKVEPARAAGTSERDGVRYYFCSHGGKQKCDAALPGEPVPQASCCGDAAAAAPVQLSAAPVRLTMTRKPSSVTANLADERHAHEAHAHHAHTVSQTGQGQTFSAEEAQAESYRTMMRKFWFAT